MPSFPPSGPTWLLVTHDLPSPVLDHHVDPMIRELSFPCTLRNEMVFSEEGSVDQLEPPVCLRHTRPRSSLHASDCSIQAQPEELAAV